MIIIKYNESKSLYEAILNNTVILFASDRYYPVYAAAQNYATGCNVKVLNCW